MNALRTRETRCIRCAASRSARALLPRRFPRDDLELRTANRSSRVQSLLRPRSWRSCQTWTRSAETCSAAATLSVFHRVLTSPSGTSPQRCERYRTECRLPGSTPPSPACPISWKGPQPPRRSPERTFSRNLHPEASRSPSHLLSSPPPLPPLHPACLVDFASRPTDQPCHPCNAPAPPAAPSRRVPASARNTPLQ